MKKNLLRKGIAWITSLSLLLPMSTPAFSEENVRVDEESGIVNDSSAGGVDLTGMEGTAAILEDLAQQLLTDAQEFQEDPGTSAAEEGSAELIIEKKD